MSVNSYLPHVVFVSEDKETRKVVTGFLGHHSMSGRRQWRNEKCRSGWEDAAEFAAEKLRESLKTYVVLVIDFDGKGRRFEKVREILTDDLMARTLVLGSMKEVEDLTRTGLGLRESLGSEIARDCEEGALTIWRHHLLEHNIPELESKAELFRGLLFGESPS